MSNNTLINCSKICVNCVANDPVDIRCGGPEYLGFDFSVKEEETDEIKKFIVLTLESLEIPLTKIYVGEKTTLTEKDVWTKERIVEEIKKDASYLQSEARRNYYSSFKRPLTFSKRNNH